MKNITILKYFIPLCVFFIPAAKAMENQPIDALEISKEIGGDIVKKIEQKPTPVNPPSFNMLDYIPEATLRNTGISVAVLIGIAATSYIAHKAYKYHRKKEVKKLLASQQQKKLKKIREDTYLRRAQDWYYAEDDKKKRRSLAQRHI